MESEVRFGLLSQIPDFPVAVPRCLFGEYHLASGSGLLITERIPFGTKGIEPHHAKARDHEIEDPRPYYDALVSALARLAGSQRAGRFPADVMAHFERRPTAGRPSKRTPATPDQIRERVLRYAEFASRVPQLLPASIRSDAFLAHLLQEAPRAVEHADALRSVVQESAPGLVAFCHWNANIDNAWFWADEDGDLACGLLDWGNVGPMNVVTSISSCLAFAEADFVTDNLPHLLARFARVFEESGGGPLDPETLELQHALHLVVGGLQWPLGAVPQIERHLPDLAVVSDRFDPRILDDEFVRTQLHLLTGHLVRWQRSDAAGLVDWAIRRSEGDPSPYQAPGDRLPPPSGADRPR
jgi:hypothetical protein